MMDLVQLTGIRKSFGGVHALRGIDFSLHAGEVHALVGENGAGKSTLMLVLGGEFAANAGEIRMNGEVVVHRGPMDAIARGVAIIHQEMALAADLTVAENIYMSEIPSMISWPALYKKTKALIERVGFDIRPSAVVRDLSQAHRQVVEIAKALSHNARIMVFDEPTAVLAGQDAERLLGIIDTLRSQGVGIVYISHRLEEVFRIADRITVMKDGATVGTLDRGEAEIEDVIRMMVGRPLSALFGEDVPRTLGAEALRVEHVGRGRFVRDVSFSVRSGEIIGLGGLIGAGRTETVRLIFGADKRDSGTISVHGKEINPNTPKDGVKAGICLVPESRKDQGVVLSMPIRVNATMARLAPLVSWFGVIRRAAERKVVNDLSSRLRIRAASIDAPVSSLSGGNQQKVVLAKWFHTGGRILIFDEPTRGVDVGAKVEIYSLIRHLAAEGCAVIVVSSEHAELFGLCDRVLVMREGQVTGTLMPPDYSEENLLKLAMTASPAAANLGGHP